MATGKYDAVSNGSLDRMWPYLGIYSASSHWWSLTLFQPFCLEDGPQRTWWLCLSLSQLWDHPQRGNTLSPSYCSCHKWGPKALADPFCTPQASLVDVCVSCSPSSSHYHPYFPTESVLRPPVFNEGRKHTSHSQFWCLWVQFNSDTTYLEIESNFKVKIQSQETALHFRCRWQTQLLPAFVLQTRGLYNPVLSCSSVAQLCPTFCHPMNGSTPGFPVLHCLLQFAPIHVHGPLFAFG